MAENERPPFTIALWGAPSVGKTSALAAYVCSTKPEWIHDKDRTTADTKRELLEKWTRFDRNQLPIGTTQPTVYQLRHKRAGRMVALRDMRGGGALALDVIDLESLRTADATILFVGWPQREDETLTALNTAMVAANNERSVLVLTKVEMHLRLEEVGLFLYDPIREAQRHGFPERLVRAMNERFYGRTFPVSIFGYGRDGLPAAYMDEFGRQLPWGVSPVNIEMPFEYVLRGVE